MINVEKIKNFQRKFATARDWNQFHTAKNLSMALAAEAGELLEIFQWLDSQQSADIMKDPLKAQNVRDELADILYYVIRISDVLGVDLEKAMWKKLLQNAKKYPVKLAKGNAKKYSELKKP